MTPTSSGTTVIDSTCVSLIDFTVYYDENGNLVTADGYLLDADGNLVVSADSELTGAYSVVGADGETYYVGEDASIVNGAILSSVDSSQDPIIVDDYGNVVDADGYILDQSDSDGNTILTIDSDSFTITARTTAEATDSDGNTVTVVSGSGYTFYTADTEAGTVYVQSSDSDATYYDSYGTLVDSSGNLINEDGSTFSTTEVTTSNYYADTVASVTYYHAVTSTSSGAGYYAYSSGDVAQIYVGTTAVEDSGYVWNAGGTTFYYLDGTSTTVTLENYNSTAVTYEQGVNTILYEIEDSDAVDNSELVYVTLGESSTANSTVTYYIYYGGYATSGGLERYTISVEIDGTLYYFAESDSVSVTASSIVNTVDSSGSANTYYVYLDLSSADNFDGYLGGQVALYASGTGITALYDAGWASGVTEYSGFFALQDVYVHSSTTLTSVTSGTSTAISSASLALYTIAASSTALYSDSDAATEVTATVATQTNMLYKGYELYVDATGAWVTATASGGTLYYLASATSSTQIDIREVVNSLTEVSVLELNGAEYVGVDTGVAGTNGNYYTFTSSVDSDATVYTSSTGFILDSESYILDAGGERQVLTAETLYTYTQSVEDTDTDGNGLGTYSYYYYYFGSEDGSEYYDSDAPLTVGDGENESIVYQVLTGVRGTIYFDSNGNTVNAAGYLMDATTFDLIYTSATELTAGYSFTSIDGTTYIVSGQATVDTASGAYIVYSGVYETRYYGDSNENSYLDDYDTEYTADELWIIIRNELGEITTYQSVEDGTEYAAEDWPGSTTETTAAV